MALPLRDKRVRRPLLTFAVVGVFWLVLDQVVKAVERRSMTVGSTIPIIKNVFHLTYIRNSGAAFSLFSGLTWLFLLVGVIAFAAMFLFWRFEKPHTVLSVVGSALMSAGAAGNIIDRVVSGQVIDIFDARIINFAIFNVADIGITVGVVMLVVWLLFFGGLSGIEKDPQTPKHDIAESETNETLGTYEMQKTSDESVD